jgi:hypothetical protein
MFLTILIAIGMIIGISYLTLNQNQTAIAQQQLPASQSSSQTISPAKQQPFVSKGISFDIDNVTFSHHMASVNGVQIHYVIGG